MTLEEYKIKILEIQKALELNMCDFFDCEFSPQREEILEVFKFYNEALLNHSYYGIVPAYIYINNYTNVNAFATYYRDKQKYSVSINIGTIIWLIQTFKLNHCIVNNTNIRLFQIIEPNIDTSINNLMYQTALHYTFYHEMAHLIQNSTFLELNLEEIPRPDGYLERKHVLELDADEFSALCLGTHLLQYVEKIFDNRLNKPIMEGMLVLMCIPIMLYLTSFNSFDYEIYFEENTHPHPVIRLFVIVLTVVQYCNESLEKEDKGFTVDHKEIIYRSLALSSQVETICFNRDKISQFIINLRDNTAGVIDYVHKFEELRKKDASLSVNKWNEHVTLRGDI
ncbi:hypothetical protein [Mariniflexile sp. HMF6888]|uniref:hypothetical protein n=1 Tax=Mariniflexile sp. HMF6888 TaxID=3373086 RepID=UPI003792954D